MLSAGSLHCLLPGKHFSHKTTTCLYPQDPDSYLLYELIDTIHLNVPDFSDVRRINPRTSLENGKHLSHSAAETDQTPPGTHPF